jgi:4-hydroxy-3-polyprenylbenzoate decarboxylase
MKVVVALTGASGMAYATHLLRELAARDCTTYIVISDNAKKLLEYETSLCERDLSPHAACMYREDDMESPLASGSFAYDAMVIVPCSLKSLAAIAHGLALNLVARAALCCLKEGRKLIVVPRETPLDLISLSNLVMLKRAGAVVLPAAPGFYHRPETVDDVIDYVVGKILEQLGLEHDLYARWEGHV